MMPRMLLLGTSLVLAASGSIHAIAQPLQPDTRRTVEDALFTGDLPEIAARGTLRVLVERESDTFLPRHGASLYAERELAAAFAEQAGLDIEFVFVEQVAELLPALLAGRGDIAADNLTITDSRRAEFAFSRPLEFTRDTLVARAGSDIPAPDDVLTGTVAARSETTLIATAERLATEHAGLSVIEIDTDANNEDVIDRLVAGEFDYALQDSNVLERLLRYRDDIVAGPAVSDPRPLGWALRPDNPELLAAVNAYLATYYFLTENDAQYADDLPVLQQRGRLRMITRNNAATYFMWQGELLGFEYELARRFAQSQGLRLEVVVAPSHDDMIPMLLSGQGDFIASFLAPTQERLDQGIVFTRPYHYASEIVVGRSDEPDMDSLEQLDGREIAVRRSSAYWTHIETLQAEGQIDFRIEEAPPDMETQEIIDAVGDGRLDLSVADSHLLQIEMTWRDDVKGLLNLGDEQAHAWAVRPENPLLLEALNRYLRTAYRGLEYNLSYRKYFSNPRYVRSARSQLIAPGRISPYDDVVRAHAVTFDFDWRLVVAQMYQESRFDPEAQSWMGAQGLMQVLPRTAEEFGFDDITDPAINIQAGVRYLSWVRERFPETLSMDERTWFALAGYNAGHGHVRDARLLARELGYDPDRWFNNVEYAMLRLEEPEYARRARHGYVRGSEPVRYVREIRQRFQAYASLLSL